MTEKYIKRVFTLHDLGIDTDNDIIKYYNYFCGVCRNINIERDIVSTMSHSYAHPLSYYYDVKINDATVGSFKECLSDLTIYNNTNFYYSFRTKFELSPNDTYFLLKTFLEKRLNYLWQKNI